jgi:rhamnosyl/mannosyltransferase
MAAGCPVINTDIPYSGVPWVSPHGVSGVTVPVRDGAALASASRRLLEEPGLRERLAAGARERAVAEFDHDVMARRLLQAYRQAINGSQKVVRATV